MKVQEQDGDRMNSDFWNSFACGITRAFRLIFPFLSASCLAILVSGEARALQKWTIYYIVIVLSINIIGTIILMTEMDNRTYGKDVSKE